MMMDVLRVGCLLLGLGVLACHARAASAVTNAFGVCYDTETKTFTVERSITRHLFCPTLSWRVEELEETAEDKETRRYDVVGRINEQYWVVRRTGEGEGKRGVLFRLTSARKADEAPCYALLDTSKSALDAIRAEGDFLGLGYGWPQEGVLLRGEHIPGLESLDDVWQYGDECYVIGFEGLGLITGRRFFTVDLASEEIVQLPFFVLMDVWNGHAFGAVPGKKGFSCRFYDLGTKEATSFLCLPMLGKPLWLNREEVLITPTEGYYSPGWQCLWNPATNETAAQDAFIARVGAVLLRRASQEGRILSVADRSNATLWESRVDGQAQQRVEWIDLDKDKAGEHEAMIIKEGEHAVLVDCLNGRVYEAEQVLHHGFGFFELTVKGRETWVTL